MIAILVLQVLQLACWIGYVMPDVRRWLARRHGATTIPRVRVAPATQAGMPAMRVRDTRVRDTLVYDRGFPTVATVARQVTVHESVWIGETRPTAEAITQVLQLNERAHR